MSKGSSALKRISVQDAVRKFFETTEIKQLEPEEIPIHDALGRVLAEDIVADRDVPNFDRAAMDGFAVRASDTFGASQENPAILKVIRSVEIGEVPAFMLEKNQAAYIPTGGAMPKGSDAVIRVEHTKKISDDEIQITFPIASEKDVSKRGEDFTAGEILLRKGEVLKPADLGIVISLEKTTVKVIKKPLVALISTGNELVEAGKPVPLCKVASTNRTIISGMVIEAGATPLNLGIARDNLDEIENKIKEGIGKTDIIITMGGAGPGTNDFVCKAIEKFGSIIIHGVAIKPGKVAGLGIVSDKPIVFLSGYPIGAMIGFETLAKPVIRKMLGVSKEIKTIVKARAVKNINSMLKIREFVRVRVFEKESQLFVEPLKKGSGVLSSMVRANGLLVIPEGKDRVETGEEVEVELFRPVE
ncbi:MAG: molybdopterin molybdotransferase MoeA [Euryarchaeota archaeon]|nr:molybdopterin molybdotransferase MoeA [Euryarchaeota archaeon]